MVVLFLVGRWRGLLWGCIWVCWVVVFWVWCLGCWGRVCWWCCWCCWWWFLVCWCFFVWWSVFLVVRGVCCFGFWWGVCGWLVCRGNCLDLVCFFCCWLWCVFCFFWCRGNVWYFLLLWLCVIFFGWVLDILRIWCLCVVRLCVCLVCWFRMLLV